MLRIVVKDCWEGSIHRGMALLIPISVEAPPPTQIPTARNRILLSPKKKYEAFILGTQYPMYLVQS